MAKDLSKEQRLAEYLDELISGRQIDWSKVEPDLRPELEFASRMLENRDEAPVVLRDVLRSRLANKIARGEYAAKPGFWDRIWTFAPGSPALRIATAAALVLVIILGSTVWITYSGRPSQETAMKPAAAPSAPSATVAGSGSAYTLDLPSNNVPRDLNVSNSAILTKSPGRAQVYNVESPHVTSESVKQLGNKLGFKGEAAYEDNGKVIVMRDGEGRDSRQMTVWVASGAIQYGYRDIDRVYPGAEPALPPTPQAKKAAYDFLGKLSLLPPGYPAFDKVQNMIQVVTTAGTVSNAGGASNLLVKLPYLVNGVQASGPGARMEVTVGSNGEILGFLWAWRQVTSPSYVDIVSPDTAYQDLINGRGSLDVPSNTGAYNIERVDLSYWINAFTEPQDVVLPVYIFKGEAVDRQGNRLEEVDAWSNAIH